MNTRPSPSSIDSKPLPPWREVGWALLGFGLVTVGLVCMATSPPPGLSPQPQQQVRSAGRPPTPPLQDLAFLGRFARSPVQTFTPPRPGWVQEILVAPGQHVEAGEPLARFWREPPDAPAPPQALVETRTAAEKAQREKAAVEAAIRNSMKRLNELQQRSQAAQQKLAAARNTLKRTLQQLEEHRANRTARYEAWKRVREEALEEVSRATRAVTQALADQAAAQSRLEAATREQQTTAAQAKKLQRLYDLGVVPRVQAAEAEARRKQAEKAVVEARSALQAATEQVKAARKKQQEAEARLDALAAPPAPGANEDTELEAKTAREVESARQEAETIQGQVTAELNHADQLREALGRAEQRLAAANAQWREAQIAAGTPDAKLLTTLAAPCDLVVEDVSGEARTRVTPADPLLTYREGTGWQVEFTAPTQYRGSIIPGRRCRVKLLTDAFPQLEATVLEVGPPEKGELPVTALVGHPPSQPAPCEALIRVEVNERPSARRRNPSSLSPRGEPNPGDRRPTLLSR